MCLCERVFFLKRTEISQWRKKFSSISLCYATALRVYVLYLLFNCRIVCVTTVRSVSDPLQAMNRSLMSSKKAKRWASPREKGNKIKS